VKEQPVLEIRNTKGVNEAPRDNSSMVAWEIYYNHYHMNPTDHHHKPSSSTNSQTLNPTYDSYPLIHQLQTEISDHDTQFIL
jgi:hypothetical protein